VLESREGRENGLGAKRGKGGGGFLLEGPAEREGGGGKKSPVLGSKSPERLLSDCSRRREGSSARGEGKRIYFLAERRTFSGRKIGNAGVK